MKKLITPILICCCLIASNLGAQVRYIDEVFTTVDIQNDITYGQNFTYPNFNSLSSLKMDVYTPQGDTATRRPVILLSPNGSFLDPAVTAGLLGYCFKGKKDSCIVELCKRFARRGYVAIAFEYRVGWNPQAADEEVRKKTIIQSVYRAAQDARGLVRFLKNDFASLNQWGVDTGKIVIGGSNSGAYVALAAGNLNDTSELTGIKFVGVGNIPFIDPAIMGDFEGFNAPQTNDNYPGISSAFQAVFALGGSVGDTSWIQQGEVPVIAFHGVNETATPYNTNVVTTTTGQPVVEVSGSGDFMPIVTAYGNNAGFTPNTFPTGPINRNGIGQSTTVIDGLYPFYGQGTEPWNWYECAAMAAFNPGSSKAKAMRYIDTIMTYTSPRLYKLLIDTAFGEPSGIFNTNENETAFNVYPNPASSTIEVVSTTAGNMFSNIKLFDLSGRKVVELNGLQTQKEIINLNGINNGTYILKTEFLNGAVSNARLVVTK